VEPAQLSPLQLMSGPSRVPFAWRFAPLNGLAVFARPRTERILSQQWIMASISL
jgi:hypothetical protein